MGKHSTAATDAATDASRSATRAIPVVLAQTAMIGAGAVVVTVLALIWSGVDAQVAAVCGAGLLAIGAVAFLILRRTGLVTDEAPVKPAPADRGDADTPAP